ncbi:Transcription accessory protein [Fulvivirga imtechensis AK7]|uniref:Transcription accessory protein n=1 Tax=Fulvivirga imtechensis AK7 TaxID=1237149 RepID=L8JYY3_9BACT|nr:Tex family protein [Fulvivirga imtechensis]ELR72417.1 Transcription accessory protein [Fulvivirga imtechensis AK7]
MDKNISIVAVELGIREKQVSSVVDLLDEGGTVPFISRYRKEMTGSLDEVAITAIRDRITQLRDLDKRREAILKSIEKQEKLTPELEKAINEAQTLAELEDIYLPYKPKRKTRATVAREKGLEPLAKQIFDQENIDVQQLASQFISEEKEVANEEEALQGARDIIAEWMNEDQETRKRMRQLFEKDGVITSRVIKGKEEEGQKYKDYFEWEEPIAKTPSHRLLAMRRGEKEMILSLDICPDEASGVQLLEKLFVKGYNQASEQVKMAATDCYKRLLKPSMETEIRINSKTKADEEAIRVFADNLRQLLLAAPLGQMNVLALDPGFRTGCKVVVLDKQGKLLHNDAIYPNEPQRKVAESGALIKYLCEKYNVEAIAIGNGTASRETESFVRNLGLPKNILVLMVNESGASVYSASDVARDEFPDHDVTVRGAVSIGRRLMDPLAELVKIDPKSIGVGQYQHDVDQNALKHSLDDVVMSCVNSVGVELNTASKELLSYVSGLGPQLAKSIVQFRNENGPFKDRKSLTKVSRLGDKAFEQAAGFLRIRGAKNPLDQSAVHPESYHIVESMAADLGCSVQDLIDDVTLRNKIDLKKYVTDTVGLPTLTDILDELAKPGRDPRETFEAFSFQEGINNMEDLRVGMVLPGIVTNITNFGAFVDIGVHQDGLVHVSHLSDSFVKNPAEVVSVQQKVTVTVVEVDINRKRIALSMKSDPFGKQPAKPKKKQENLPEGDLQEKLNKLKGLFNG